MGKKRVPISLRKPSPDSAKTADPREAAPAIGAEGEPWVVGMPVTPALARETDAVEAAPIAATVELPVEVSAPASVAMSVPNAAPPPWVVLGSSAAAMQGVTVFLPAEIVDRLVAQGEHGRDAVRQAVEATLRMEASRLRTKTANDTSSKRRWVNVLVGQGRGQEIVARVERWIDAGRAIVTSARMHIRAAAA